MKNIYIVLFFIFLISCNIDTHTDPMAVEELLELDKEFSDYSKKYGYRKAFLQYADSAAVLLKPEMMPIKGGLAIRRYYLLMNNPEMGLSWIPLDGNIAQSKDLGYTYGIWEASYQDSSLQGTYVTIWGKDETGNWKYLLDSGNEGLGY